VPRRAEHLLEVATAHFVRLGYGAATLDGIAAEAGVAKRTIYARYPDKQALFFAVVRRLTERRVFETLPIGHDVPLEEGLRRLARPLIVHGLGAEELVITRMIQAELNHFPDLGNELWDALETEYRARLVAYFEHQKQKGAIRDISPDFLAALFMDIVFGFVNRVAVMRQAVPTSGQIDEYIDRMVGLITAGMRA
jgi:AcrR family transcriptional regulator